MWNVCVRGLCDLGQFTPPLWGRSFNSIIMKELNKLSHCRERRPRQGLLLAQQKEKAIFRNAGVIVSCVSLEVGILGFQDWQKASQRHQRLRVLLSDCSAMLGKGSTSQPNMAAFAQAIKSSSQCRKRKGKEGTLPPWKLPTYSHSFPPA